MPVDLRDLRHDAARDAILDAASTLAADGGFAQLSMRAIAAAVGVRAPSLYSYFPSKDAILDGLFARGFAAMDSALVALGEDLDELDRVDGIVAVLAGYLAFCQADWTRYQLMFTRAVPGWQPTDEAYASSERALARTSALLARLGATRPRDVDLFTAISAGLAAQQFTNDPAGDRWVRLVPDAAALFAASLEPVDPSDES